MKVDGVAPPEPGRAVRIQVEGTTVAVFNVGGQLLGLEARCTHVGGPLDQGRLEGPSVVCPWHGSQFDLRTGAVRRGPATQPVRAYHVRAEGGSLLVEPV